MGRAQLFTSHRGRACIDTKYNLLHIVVRYSTEWEYGVVSVVPYHHHTCTAQFNTSFQTPPSQRGLARNVTMSFIFFTFVENVEQHLGELWVLVEINQVRETIVHLQRSKLLWERKRRGRSGKGKRKRGKG